MMTIDHKLRAIKKATRWNQQQMAEHFGVTQATVSRWFSGSVPEGDKFAAINELYENVATEGPRTDDDGYEIAVMGFVGAGAEIMPDFEQVPPEGIYQITLPFSLPAEMMAFEVRGDSMLPVYKDGFVIVVYREQQRPLDSFYGEEAAVRTSDGRRFIKTIQRGRDGRVNLSSFNAPLIEDVSLEWIGEIFTTMPRRQWKKMDKVGGIQGRLRLA